MQERAGGRATAEESIHLTLAFLGEADARKASAAAESVRSGAFELPIDAAKYWKHNKIVWVGPAAMPAGLAALVEKLHGALRRGGFALEDRPFAAHITLLRKAEAPRSIPPLPAVTWPAREFALVRSTSAQTGSRYENVGRFTLK